jgi:hypothetical protein
MTGPEPPRPQAQLLPAADIQAQQPPVGSSLVHQSFPVRQPEEDSSEFLVRVRASTLRRVRTKLGELAEVPFPLSELLLGLSTLAIGTFLGALTADVTAGTAKAVFFYTVLPVVGVSSLVAYLLLRRGSQSDTHRVGNDALSELPDPDKTR